MEEKLEIKSKLRVQDVFRFNLYVAYNTKINMIFSVISIISLGVFIYNMINTSQSAIYVLSNNFGLLIAPFIFFIIIPFKVLAASKDLIGTKTLEQEVTYIFTEDFVTLKVDEESADIAWSDYVKIKETRNDYRFFLDKVQAQLIPKYNLKDQEIEALRKMIENARK